MSNESTPDPSSVRLSEELAHRVLARAIELEQHRDAQTTVAELRAIALEAGISMPAFDAALAEAKNASLQGEPSLAGQGGLARLWTKLRHRGTREVGRSDVLTVSVAAFLAFWVLTFVLTRTAIGSGWQVMELTILASTVLGVGIARALRAKLVAIGLLGFAAFQTAEFAMHAMFGVESVQGGATHWAVMIAGVLGAVLGARFERGAAAPPTEEAQLQHAKLSTDPTSSAGARPAEPGPGTSGLRAILGTA